MRRKRRRTRWLVLLAGVAALAVVLGPGTACSPLYVIRAGWEEARILRGRQPIDEVIAAPETTERTRVKLRLATEARAFARDRLGLDVGDSYTTYTELDRDTLAMVLSAAHRDRLEAVTWWFPIVGNVPYRGFFDLEGALREQESLEAEGFDTLLRPTSAFSTLGWFSDPLLSTVVRYDEVELVTTVIHELSHNHLFVPGRVRFNESFATWVGRAGAVQFFCNRQGEGPNAEWCRSARGRWDDVQRFSRFMDELVADLQALYGDPELPRAAKVAGRERIFASHLERFRNELRPRLVALSFAGFESTPLNNATLLARMRYYHRLPAFESLSRRHGGSLATAIRALAAAIPATDDPFTLLPASPPAARPDPATPSAP